MVRQAAPTLKMCRYRSGCAQDLNLLVAAFGDFEIIPIHRANH